MAGDGEIGDVLVAKFKEFCTVLGDKDATQMTSEASAKLVYYCFEKAYSKYDVKTLVDAIVFPTLKEYGKPYMTVDKANCDKYVQKTAHEIAKRKTNNIQIALDDPDVEYIRDHLCSLISACDYGVKSSQLSATGTVEEQTDASELTGAHKERW